MIVICFCCRLLFLTLIWGLILGAIAGLLASKLMSEKSGMIKNILLGIGGGFVGGLVFKVLGFTATGMITSQNICLYIRMKMLLWQKNAVCNNSSFTICL